MGNCFGLRRRASYLLNNDGDESSIDDESYRNTSAPHREHQRVAEVYHPTPGISIRATDLTEDEQIQIAMRIGLIQFLPLAKYFSEPKEKANECIICMCDLRSGDEVRYLPCLHTFHRVCIDDWLMRSFSCPSCLRPIDRELLGPYVSMSGGGSVNASGANVTAIPEALAASSGTACFSDDLTNWPATRNSAELVKVTTPIAAARTNPPTPHDGLLVSVTDESEKPTAKQLMQSGSSE